MSLSDFLIIDKLGFFI